MLRSERESMDLKRLSQTLRYYMILNSTKRGDYIRRKKIFGHVGDKVRLPNMLIPLRADQIFLGNNVEVASGARFVVHDAIHLVFNNMPGCKERCKEHVGRIEVGNNVFIGADAIILSPVKIGDNVVIAAGAVVNRDIPSGSVAAGVPAKVIGSFDDLRKKRLNASR